MATIQLICDETPGLTLGPGSDTRQVPGQSIKFELGYASFEEADFPDWQAWISATGTPHIEVVDAADSRVPATASVGFDCPDCDKSFASQKALNGHRMSHRNK